MSDPNQQQIQVEVPPMVTALDHKAVQAILSGLGELPGKVSTPYIVMLSQQWDAHCKKHIDAARAKAQAEAEAAAKAEAAAAAPPPNRAARRAKR